MIFKDKSDEVDNVAEELGELDEALTNFRLSIHAWSEAAFSRERTAIAPVEIDPGVAPDAIDLDQVAAGCHCATHYLSGPGPR